MSPNIDAPSRNHCCRRKIISKDITYAECVSVALVIQYANRVHFKRLLRSLRPLVGSFFERNKCKGPMSIRQTQFILYIANIKAATYFGF
jgi:hypothetical protein